MMTQVQQDVDGMLLVECERQSDGVMFAFADGTRLFLQNGGELEHVENEIGAVVDWRTVKQIPEGYYLVGDRPDEI